MSQYTHARTGYIVFFSNRTSVGRRWEFGDDRKTFLTPRILHLSVRVLLKFTEPFLVRIVTARVILTRRRHLLRKRLIVTGSGGQGFQRAARVKRTDSNDDTNRDTRWGCKTYRRRRTTGVRVPGNNVRNVFGDAKPPYARPKTKTTK